MPVVIFVHGIGGRSENYHDTFLEIQEKIKDNNLDFKLIPCLWGDEYGAKLKADGASIPEYKNTGGKEGLNKAQRDIIKWKKLKDDPLWEITRSGYRGNEEDEEPSLIISKNINNLLKRIDVFIETSAFSANMETYEEQIKELADELNISLEEYIEETHSLIAKIDECGIDEPLLRHACELVKDSPVYERWLETVGEPLEAEYSVFVRAMLATSIFYLNEANLTPSILWDTEKREEIIDYIVKILTRDTQSRGGESDWIRKSLEDLHTFCQKALILQVGGIFDHATTPLKKKRRGAITDSSYPMAGDILVYQYAKRGKKIRDEIQKQIDSYKDQDVILLAHSLGGVACVDLLLENLQKGKKLPVKLLITVGSQAPFFYEIGALQSFPYEIGKPLPSGFPEWLNIYDLNDFLSYIGENLFPNQIKDQPVGNKLPVIGSHLIESHVGYWKNQETWDAISDFWESIKNKEENEQIES